MNTDKSSTHQHTVRGVSSTSTGVHSHALTATDAALAALTVRITKLEAAMADVILSITKLTGPTVPPGPGPVPPPVQPPVPPPIEPTPGTGTKNTYGPAYAMDSLNNDQIGSSLAATLSYRFRAEQSSALNSVRYYIVGPSSGSGYGQGTGGTFHVTLQSDDGTSNHYPSGTVLATATDLVHPDDDANALATFPSPATLVAGTLYHIVWTNTDAAPATNWASVDAGFVYDLVNPRQPKWPNTDWYNLVKLGSGAWDADASGKKGCPIADLTYANGSHQGNGYMENSGVGDAYYTLVSGTTKMARETFTVSGSSRSVFSVSLRLSRTSGTDPLVVRLETGAGVEIESVNIPAASIAVHAPGYQASPMPVWVTATFLTSHVLVSGQTYHLRLSTAAGTEYSLTQIRKGSAYTYHSSTYFSDGNAEKTTNGSTWVDAGPAWSQGENDFQFYFVTAP